jgi:hypothetical protein
MLDDPAGEPGFRLAVANTVLGALVRRKKTAGSSWGRATGGTRSKRGGHGVLLARVEHEPVAERIVRDQSF